MVLPLPFIRLSRLRQHPGVRQLVQETHISLCDLVLPLFIKDEQGEKLPITSMPGHYQIPLNQLASEIDEIVNLGIQSIILFGIPSFKDFEGSDSYQEEGIIQKALKLIKKQAPHLVIIVDSCLCEYTDHGHCGVLSQSNHSPAFIDNDRTLAILAKQAVSYARAGADVIAPSGMMDGAVRAIRHALDNAQFFHLPILSYSIKYHSALYGPFRMAAEGAPLQGDRSSHQMNPANSAEALREAQLDIEEGADMLMVKPAHTYLDIIERVKKTHPFLPLGAYHTSGEFCMIKAAAEKGWIDERKVAREILLSIKRAGANFIITYYAKEFAHWITNK